MKLAAALVPSVVCAFLGCGSDKKAEDLPKTHPVSGKLIGRDGKAVTEGNIEFRHVTKTEYNSMGEIEKDGTFRLRIMTRTSGALDGAQEGEHTVTYIPGGKGETPPVTLKKKYLIKEGSNNITVTLE